ncbi:hypothetical protein SASPL_115053 [Salvia splendens]|uniref:Chromo domain-containing protein n=1 Tax=Salvia splendens TaxID=180675 RepID=A0A8X8Y1Q8_SALSN|nr:hypothetical protein SASPL_115053 [Salvia splendens]
MSTHSASGTTPFKIVYGRPPPTIHSYLSGEVRAQAVVESLQSRDAALGLLRQHLLLAHQRMVCAANKHRMDVEYAVGDLVYLKFRPYRKSMLFTATNRKLAPRFFGPFRVEERIGTAAYRLKLPVGSRIHPVFHVSLLKRAIDETTPETDLPEALFGAEPPILLEEILQRRMVTRDGAQVEQVLVKWSNLPLDEATWMDTADLRG